MVILQPLGNNGQLFSQLWFLGAYAEPTFTCQGILLVVCCGCLIEICKEKLHLTVLLGSIDGNISMHISCETLCLTPLAN